MPRATAAEAAAVVTGKRRAIIGFKAGRLLVESILKSIWDELPQTHMWIFAF